MAGHFLWQSPITFRSDRQKASDIPIEPFAECARYLDEAATAVSHAEEVADYQAIGSGVAKRC